MLRCRSVYLTVFYVCECTLRDSNYAIFILPFFSKGVGSSRNDFAPQGASSFFWEWTLFLKRSLVQGGKLEV